jgi:hypothetical protein
MYFESNLTFLVVFLIVPVSCLVCSSNRDNLVVQKILEPWKKNYVHLDWSIVLLKNPNRIIHHRIMDELYRYQGALMSLWIIAHEKHPKLMLGLLWR